MYIGMRIEKYRQHTNVKMCILMFCITCSSRC